MISGSAYDLAFMRRSALLALSCAFLWICCRSVPGPGGNADGGDLLPGEPIVAPEGVWTWIPVAGSRCGSGATAGIGVNLSSVGSELFLYLQGGGACWNQGTCVPSWIQWGPLCDYGSPLCLVDAAGGTQPTSVYVTAGDPFPADGGGAFPSELAAVRGVRAFDRADLANPFREATFVFVPYCTGDLHAGDAERQYSYNYGGLFDPNRTYTMHFAGARNVDLYLQRLLGTHPNLRRIWLTGSSAGGYGATLNFDRVQRAFPGAEVHLLADSAPLMQPTAHWEQWRDTWNIRLPAGCEDCASGMPQILQHLADAHPTRRIGLLAYDQDAVISWFFFAGPGLANFTSPPLGSYAAGLSSLLSTYDARANLGYFVLPGTQHVLWAGYGQALGDGGYTAPLPSAGGNSDLKTWIDAWATGDAGFDDER